MTEDPGHYVTEDGQPLVTEASAAVATGNAPLISGQSGHTVS